MNLFFRALFILFTAVFLSGCNAVVLNPKGSIAAQQYNILLISVVLMLMVVIPVIILSFIFAWRYRENNPKADYQPEWAHSVKLELIWWAIPCMIIAILGVITWKSSHSLDPFKPIERSDKQTLTIQVMALEWKWLFIYPEQNIASVNYLQLPVNVPVKFEITSNGPMNSFLIPQLGGQVYAMAGMKTELNLIADASGDYAGLSANFSGEGFGGMKFIAHVSTQKEFDEWVQRVKLSNHTLTLAAYNELALPSESKPVYYSSVKKNLFKFVVMRTMMPEKDVWALCFGNATE
jgi:cytochrome o ubiquinol oxidase subunit 2